MATNCVNTLGKRVLGPSARGRVCSQPHQTPGKDESVGGAGAGII